MTRVALALHVAPMLYEAAIASEVFGVDRRELSPAGQWYDFVVCTADGAPHPWLASAPTAGYDALGSADLVVVPSTEELTPDPEGPLPRALRAAHAGGARVASLCTGAFVLAAAGLLDGRRAATHWMHADELAQRYPLVDVRSDVLYTDEGDVLTSAGKTAALDLCIHLVRRDFGAAAASGLARRLVAPAHRSGGQAQFVAPAREPRPAHTLAPALDWARERLDGVTVEALAARAGLSSRQLARRMQTEVGSGPLDWLQQQRVARAQELLESTDASVDQVATMCGLGTATTLRRHFQRHVGVSPTAYRTTFRLV